MPFYANVEKIICSGDEIERVIGKLSSKVKDNPFVKNCYKELQVELKPISSSRTPNEYLFVDIKRKYQIETGSRQILNNSRYGGLSGILTRPQL